MNYESDKSSKNSHICVVGYKSLHSAPCGRGYKDDYQSDQIISNIIVTFPACLVWGVIKLYSVHLFLLRFLDY